MRQGGTNSATISVDQYTFVYDEEKGDINAIASLASEVANAEEHNMHFDLWKTAWAVTKAVHSVEKTLVNWLHNLGFEVKFG